MNDNEPIIKCDKCGNKADFGVENSEIGLPFTNYCHKCFAENHPEAVKVKDDAVRLADDYIDKLFGGSSGETFH